MKCKRCEGPVEYDSPRADVCCVCCEELRKETMPRILKIDLFDMLDLVSAAKSYGYNDDVLMSAFAKWAKPTKEEIEAFADRFVDEEHLVIGYSEEDRDEIYKNLMEWHAKYCNNEIDDGF